MVNTISPRQLAELRNSGAAVELLDVRTPLEFSEVHVDFARNVPLDQLSPEQLSPEQLGRAAQRSEPLYVICRSGGRGKQACEKLSAAGLNVVNVEGGTLAWEQAGLSVVRSAQKVVSLERQVRIAAGALVLLSAILGYFVHPYFIALAAFVGAGLVFAGVTDTCGMGLMLSRMPWNKQSIACDTASGTCAPSTSHKSTATN